MTEAQINQRRNAGRALYEKRGSDYMKSIGRNGGLAMWRNNTIIPINGNDFAIINRATGQPTGKTMNGKYIPSHRETEF